MVWGGGGGTVGLGSTVLYQSDMFTDITTLRLDNAIALFHFPFVYCSHEGIPLLDLASFCQMSLFHDQDRALNQEFG